MNARPRTRIANWRDLPLAGDGRCLIEASAGTGKTWTIAVLYLRLLLECGIGPRRIVVTTFTNAAAQELRERMRARLAMAVSLAERCIASDMASLPAATDEGDAWLHERWLRADASATADLHRLHLAQAEFDLAPISTLHGLCRRILADFPFETGSAFDPDEQVAADEIDRELRDDLWRRLAQSAEDHDEGDDVWFNAGRKVLDEALKLALRPGVAVRAIGGGALDRTMRPENAAMIRGWVEHTAFKSAASVLRRGLLNLADYIDAGDPQAPWPDKLKEDLKKPLETQIKPHALPAAADHDVLRFAADALEALAHADAPAKSAALVRYRERLIAQREQRLRERGQLSFDAQIARVHVALHGENGTALAARLFAEWPVALVDEFQDTDAQQYAILDRIYRNAARETGDALHAPRGRLVMIGDPKQAIYRFRGGDIEAYLVARRSADAELKLITNYRSSSGLIAAFNGFYGLAGEELSQREAASPDARIAYEAMTAGGKADAQPLLEDGVVCERPLVFHVATDANGNKEVRRDAALVACADLIAQTLQARRHRLGDRPVRPGDLAVLVPENRDIERLRGLLGRRRVPCVGSGRSNVFQTEVARELAILLYAIEHAGEPSAVRAALSTRFLGFGLDDLRALADAPERWQEQAERFVAWKRQWRRLGVQAAIGSVLAVDPRAFVSAGDAERALADVRHLGELLQEASMQCDGPESLLAWFATQREDPSAAGGEAGDERQLRIESDARRVRLLTLHQSKGLQFPIVFLPLMWAHEGKRPGMPLVRDPTTGGLLLDLGSDGFDAAVIESMQADQDERFRVLYVALTRAQYACHAHAFAQDPKPCDLQSAPLAAMFARLRERLAEGRDLADACPWIAWCSDDWVRERVTYVADTAPAAPSRIARSEPAPAPFESRYSFSSLTSHRTVATDEDAASDEIGAAGESARLDPFLRDDASMQAIEGEAVHPQLAALGAWRGVEFGNALHAIFERRAIGQSMAAQPDLVRACLRDAGVQVGELSPDEFVARVVSRMQSALDAALLPGLPSPRLSALAATRLRAEMEFHFVLKAASLRRLREACAAHGEPDLVPPGSERILRGLMTGKIDLVFEHEGRFHVLDYKSNHLGERLSDYAPAALREVMDAHAYRFQALLYTVALDRYLRQRLRGYRRDRHLGEAIYFFVRAVGLAPDAGVWTQRFDGGLIDAVDAALAAAVEVA
ncbi:MAG TPA: UvrD-helicase domain-containing protein [Xanthomonadaceae bacterium]|jgi:exodeoxyribonuclease V beta subunit|nr:UvrD-helicase domain-containing protein [Xanthomonadaceae bacterium]